MDEGKKFWMKNNSNEEKIFSENHCFKRVYFVYVTSVKS